MLYFRSDFPCRSSTPDVFLCVKSCINETDIHAVFSYGQYEDIYYREPKLSLLGKILFFSSLFITSPLRKKFQNPLRFSFSKSSLTYRIKLMTLRINDGEAFDIEIVSWMIDVIFRLLFIMDDIYIGDEFNVIHSRIKLLVEKI